jgi:hypothetical protein
VDSVAVPAQNNIALSSTLPGGTAVKWTGTGVLPAWSIAAPLYDNGGLNGATGSFIGGNYTVPASDIYHFDAKLGYAKTMMSCTENDAPTLTLMRYQAGSLTRPTTILDSAVITTSSNMSTFGTVGISGNYSLTAGDIIYLSVNMPVQLTTGYSFFTVPALGTGNPPATFGLSFSGVRLV